MIDGYAVTDVHVHVHPEGMIRPEAGALLETGRGGGPSMRALGADPRLLLSLLDAWGIERAAIITYVSPDLMGYPREINEWCARYCAAAPDRLIAFGSVHPMFSTSARQDAENLLDVGIRGFKIHPPHQQFAANAYRTGGPGEAIGEVYEVAQARGVPVMIHTGTSVFPGARNVYADPMPADDVAVDFPDLDLILAHAGRPLHAETAFFLARRHEHVWLDLSGIPPRRLLDALPRLPEIAGKCLWGSDWPGPGVRDPRSNVERFLELPLEGATKRAILHENAARLLR